MSAGSPQSWTRLASSQEDAISRDPQGRGPFIAAGAPRSARFRPAGRAQDGTTGGFGAVARAEVPQPPLHIGAGRRRKSAKEVPSGASNSRGLSQAGEQSFCAVHFGRRARAPDRRGRCAAHRVRQQVGRHRVAGDWRRSGCVQGRTSARPSAPSSLEKQRLDGENTRGGRRRRIADRDRAASERAGVNSPSLNNKRSSPKFVSRGAPQQVGSANCLLDFGDRVPHCAWVIRNLSCLRALARSALRDRLAALLSERVSHGQPQAQTQTAPGSRRIMAEAHGRDRLDQPPRIDPASGRW